MWYATWKPWQDNDIIETLCCLAKVTSVTRSRTIRPEPAAMTVPLAVFLTQMQRPERAPTGYRPRLTRSSVTWCPIWCGDVSPEHRTLLLEASFHWAVFWSPFLWGIFPCSLFAGALLGILLGTGACRTMLYYSTLPSFNLLNVFPPLAPVIFPSVECHLSIHQNEPNSSTW